ncbi:unnamed protein product [Tetraodon nigroviridis]|uniref:(spotted green pufferfish) hypothetical protein n=1 Tax=Tetraodon nigroviridis TaxID=99883 RepID=Q4SFT8_TETNG|nr:unnamed protein product [Tetraodon nigroviridis]
MGLSIPATLCRLAPPALRLNQRRMLQGKAPDIPEHVLRLAGVGPDKLRAEWTFPAFIAMFLPEFPHKAVPGHEHLQVKRTSTKLTLDFPRHFKPFLFLCVFQNLPGVELHRQRFLWTHTESERQGQTKDICCQSQSSTTKRSPPRCCHHALICFIPQVIPKAEILRLGVLEQSKEEVIIQRQVHHPFVHDLQDCWQTQRHIYIMCDYCSTGDLYTYWQMSGQFTEDTVRVFAAELGCALGHLRLADFGLSRRLERGGRAFTICGTIQYMAPEVLSGGPYNHAADWWSLGILLFSLVTGKLLCKNPSRRLRTLERFKRQTFFIGTTFDLTLLQRQPVEVTDVVIGNNVIHGTLHSERLCLPPQVILKLRERPDRAAKARRGLTLSLQPLKGFDYDSFLSPPATPETLLEAGAQVHGAGALPGPALLLQPAGDKGQRLEVFV